MVTKIWEADLENFNQEIQRVATKETWGKRQLLWQCFLDKTSYFYLNIVFGSTVTSAHGWAGVIASDHKCRTVRLSDLKWREMTLSVLGWQRSSQLINLWGDHAQSPHKIKYTRNCGHCWSPLITSHHLGRIYGVTAGDAKCSYLKT